MHRYCSCCGKDFNLADQEISLLGDAGLPLPDWCLNCRLQLRLTFCNHHSFHPGRCSISGLHLETIYHPNSGITIVEPGLWRADEQAPWSRGRQYDFSRRFFEQFRELSLAVPRPASIALGESLIRSNRVFECSGLIEGYDLVNCTISTHCDRSSRLVWCIDCLGSNSLEQCIDCIDSSKLSGCTGSIRCSNLRDSDLCVDCHDSEFLLLCWNLSGKKYCILNRECTREEFFRKKVELGMMRRTDRQVCDEVLEDIIFDNTPPERRRRLPPRSAEDLQEIERLFSFQADGSAAHSNIESIQASGAKIRYSHNIFNCTDVAYSELCFDSSNLFGCSGLRGAQYAIFNRSCTRHEYEQELKKITGLMRESGELGRFFPAGHSPFAYNESAAQQYFPLKRQEAEEFGFNWRPQSPQGSQPDNGGQWPVIRASALPEEISEVADDVLHSQMECGACSNLYRIIASELHLYRSLNYPIPELCPECRYHRRLELQPAKIFEQSAAGTAETVQLSRCIGL